MSRGCAVALLLDAFLWVVIFGALGVIVARCGG